MASWIPGGGGSGDVVGPASAVDSQVALFDGVTGELIKAATTTGLLKGTSGVLSAASQGTDYYAPGGTDVAVADGGTGLSAAGAANTLLASDGTTLSWQPNWMGLSRYVWVGPSGGRPSGGGSDYPAVIGAPAGDVAAAGGGGNLISGTGSVKTYAVQPTSTTGSVAYYGSASATAETITAVRWIEITLVPHSSAYTTVSHWAGFQAASVWSTAILDGIVSNAILIRGSTPAGDTTWKIITANGAAQTVTDTGVTIVAATPHIFLLRNDTTSWAWQVLSAARVVLASGTITGTLPTGAMGWGHQCVVRANVSRWLGATMRFSAV